MMDDVIVARALHVLVVVIWIGGVAMATTVALPAVRHGDLGSDKFQAFQAIEHRFAWQARTAIILVGLSGFYMTWRLDLWDRTLRGFRLASLDADGRDPRFRKPLVQPGRQRTCLKPNPLHGHSQCIEERHQRIRLARHSRFTHNPTCLITTTRKRRADRGWAPRLGISNSLNTTPSILWVSQNRVNAYLPVEWREPVRAGRDGSDG
jgi:hypothetical protein